VETPSRLEDKFSFSSRKIGSTEGGGTGNPHVLYERIYAPKGAL
jgi:hypothetical protein